ncbi:DMT family transporter [Companilactobacillus kimchiensis]|uniref:Integral membrane protein n=1 Tax=Companilactobacillus kimchiensis TaxID=993692 RepID=A0A0R2LFZ8_9LACO|nr:DMT family transporter [Companilactobacillus kimchiensis]KRO00729.1 hypothetical protein IV57_GL000047 [Companilactobacillus kimchiensis]
MVFIPLQTSINSQLRNRVKTPFLSSLISFLVGTVFLLILSIATGSGIPLINGSLSALPWWGYLGGIIGMICLTINIFLFPILGSVQTVIIPMVGQILISVVIDNFGWFYAKTNPLSLTKLLGLILVIVGIMVTIALPSILDKNNQQVTTTDKSKKLVWQIIALLDGFAFSIESTINGHVGTVLQSPIHSAFLTFIIASVILIVINLVQGNFRNIKFIATTHTPWWNFLGGIIGGINIFINAFLVPQIGIGLATILGLLGQIIISLVIDNWGFLGAEINKISKLQTTGILTIILGIVAIELI